MTSRHLRTTAAAWLVVLSNIHLAVVLQRITVAQLGLILFSLGSTAPVFSFIQSYSSQGDQISILVNFQKSGADLTPTGEGGQTTTADEGLFHQDT